jgi:hypothetical protein
MANSALTQQQLAQSTHFIGRVRAALASVAWQVMNEADSVPDHAARATYARAVLGSLDQLARTVAQWLVQRPNVIQFETSFDFSVGMVVTASGDPDIESQLMTDWNDIAGIGTSPAPPPPAPPEVRRR